MNQNDAQRMLGQLDGYLAKSFPHRPVYRNIRALLTLLANAEEDDTHCYCKVHAWPASSSGSGCPGGDCDGCQDCPTGRARSILVALGMD